MTYNNVYTAVIVGCGQIACGYDSPESASVLTHAHALMLQDRIRCVGVFDVDTEKAKRAAAKWKLESYSSLVELMAFDPDLVIIAVPDEFHEECLRRILDHRPRAVLCEKPLTTSYAASAEIAQRYKNAGIGLAVNYQRRFDVTLGALRGRIETGGIGRPLAGQVLYSKGIRHNGSHAVDLLRFLLGEPRSFVVERRVIDFELEDPTVAGSLRFGDVDIAFIAGDERAYSLFEIDLFFEKERIRFLHAGLRYERYVVLPDPVFPGYFELFKAEEGDTGLTSALIETYGQLVRCLDDERDARLNLDGFLKTQRVCELMAESPLDRRWNL